MKRKGILTLVLAAVLLLTACAPVQSQEGQPSQQPVSSVQENQAYHKITAQQAKEMMDQGNVTIVDVRTKEEYNTAHIEGAVLVPNETIGGEMPEELPDKDAVLLVYCRTGVRSKQASGKLVKIGYKNVYDFGGIQDWTYGTAAGEE